MSGPPRPRRPGRRGPAARVRRALRWPVLAAGLAAAAAAGAQQPAAGGAPAPPSGEAGAAVDELRSRLAERERTIERLRARIARLREELARLGAEAPEAAAGTPAPPRPSRAGTLPVSPLVLGSSLIALLVLVVVASLFRRSGAPAERRAEAEEAPEDGAGGAARGEVPEEEAADLPFGLDLEEEPEETAAPGPHAR